VSQVRRGHAHMELQSTARCRRTASQWCEQDEEPEEEETVSEKPREEYEDEEPDR